jgi:hypothetical protein
MGMQSLDKKSDLSIRKSDVSIAKNYLGEDEIKLLGLLVEQYAYSAPNWATDSAAKWATLSAAKWASDSVLNWATDSATKWATFPS